MNSEPVDYPKGSQDQDIFRYIEPKVIHLARIVFTDRAKRTWTVFLQRKDAIKAQEHFYSVQSQNIRQEYQSHNDLTRK